MYKSGRRGNKYFLYSEILLQDSLLFVLKLEFEKNTSGLLRAVEILNSRTNAKWFTSIYMIEMI